MWAARLRNERYFVAEFNAWETDFSGDPFVALSSSLQEQFEKLSSVARGINTKPLADGAKQVAMRATPVVAGLAATAAFGSGSSASDAATQLTSYAGDRLSEYHKRQEAISNYKLTLGKETLKVPNSRYESRPLFIMIDELDRCQPSYTVELLEVANISSPSTESFFY